MLHGFGPAFLGGIGLPELIIILVIVLVIFGAGKLPQLGDALGKGIRNFRNATKNEEDKEGGKKELPEGKAKGELPAAGASAGDKVADVEARDVTSSEKK